MHHSRSALRRLTLLLLAAAVVTAAGPLGGRGPLPGVRLADSIDQQIAALQSQYQSLGNQLSSLQGQEAQVSAQVVAVQAKIAQTQASLAGVQTQITQLNAAIAATEVSIQADTQRLDGERAQLSSLMVVVYTSGGSSAVAGLVDSQSIAEFMTKLSNASVASQKFQQLIASIQADQASLQSLQQTQQGQLDQAQQLSDQLQTLDAQLQGQQAQLRQEQSSLTGQAAQLVAQRNSIQGQISALQAEQLAASEAGQGWVTVNGALTPFAFGPQPDYFPWGQCTWYVASLRHVYWGGNADAWYWNAQAAGAPTGHTPQPGSIVVWGPGSLYNALYGHVAYVRYVISPTNFVVDEGNFLGLGVSDQRDVPTLYDVEGFIY